MQRAYYCGRHCIVATADKSIHRLRPCAEGISSLGAGCVTLLLISFADCIQYVGGRYSSSYARSTQRLPEDFKVGATVTGRLQGWERTLKVDPLDAVEHLTLIWLDRAIKVEEFGRWTRDVRGPGLETALLKAKLNIFFNLYDNI